MMASPVGIDMAGVADSGGGSGTDYRPALTLLASLFFGSRFSIMAIAGGTLVVVQGWIADRYGPRSSFLPTAACALYVLSRTLWGSGRPTRCRSRKS